MDRDERHAIVLKKVDCDLYCSAREAGPNDPADGVRVELNYPRTEAALTKFIEVGLCDVRAADSIRIDYDYDRDGWRIMQQAFNEHGGASEPEDWHEVYFAQAWQLEKPSKEDQRSIGDAYSSEEEDGGTT